MANTTIRLKGSGVTGNVPATLAPGELAINYADGVLFYGNTTSSVQAFDVVTQPSGLDGDIQFNDLGLLGSDVGFSYNKTTNTLSTSNINTSTISLTSSFETTNTFTTSSLSQVSVDSFATATYRASKYFVQMTSGASYHIIDINLIHDGSNVYLSQFGEVKTGSTLGIFDASITTGILNLWFTPININTTVKLSRYNIVV